MLRILKGSDARVRTISERAGLVTYVKIVYEGSEKWEPDVLADDVLNTEDVNQQYHTNLRHEMEQMGILIQTEEERMRYEDPDAAEVRWVTDILDINEVSSSYIRYGNDASIGHVYGNAALFVEIPAFGEGVRV